MVISPVQALYFVIFVLLLQQFDGNILGPKILGNATGLSSFWVMFAILLFGGVMGFAGMVIGVPLFAVLYSMLTEKINHLLKKRGLSVDTNDYRGHKRIDPETHAFVEAQETMPPVSAKSAAVRHSRKIRKTKPVICAKRDTARQQCSSFAFWAERQSVACEARKSCLPGRGTRG